MIILDYIIIALMFGLGRAIAGSGVKVGRVWQGFLALTSFSLVTDLLTAGLATALLILGMSFGWGKYFSVLPFVHFPRERSDFPPADLISNLIFDKTQNSQLAGFVGMGVRWSIGLLPLFLFINWKWALGGAVAIFIVGLLYRGSYIKYDPLGDVDFEQRWRLAEFLTGTYLGIIISGLHYLSVGSIVGLLHQLLM